MGARAAILAGAACLALAVSSAPAAGEAWRWTDERGVVHFTDNAPSVPKRYRDEAERVELSDRPGVVGGVAAVNERVQERIVAGAQGRFAEADLQAIEAWMDSWGMGFLAAGIPWMAVTLAAALHALMRRRFLWALSNVVLWVVSVPLYLLLRFEPRTLGVRLVLLALWTAPFVVGGLAMHAAMRSFGA